MRSTRAADAELVLFCKNMKKDPHDMAMAAEEDLAEFIRGQIDGEPTSRFADYAEVPVSLQELIKSSVLRYPRFLEIEGVIVRESHYSEENWKAWCAKHTPKEAANVLNHTHIGHLYGHEPRRAKLENHLGEILCFFWQLTVRNQFPNHNVTVSFDGDIIDIMNE